MKKALKRAFFESLQKKICHITIVKNRNQKFYEEDVTMKSLERKIVFMSGTIGAVITVGLGVLLAKTPDEYYNRKAADAIHFLMTGEEPKVKQSEHFLNGYSADFSELMTGDFSSLGE